VTLAGCVALAACILVRVALTGCISMCMTLTGCISVCVTLAGCALPLVCPYLGGQVPPRFDLAEVGHE
jgi:hypothetical protein